MVDCQTVASPGPGKTGHPPPAGRKTTIQFISRTAAIARLHWFDSQTTQTQNPVPPWVSGTAAAPVRMQRGWAGDCGPAPVQDRGPGPPPDHDGEQHCGPPPDWVCDRDHLSFGLLWTPKIRNGAKISAMWSLCEILSKQNYYTITNIYIFIYF